MSFSYSFLCILKFRYYTMTRNWKLFNGLRKTQTRPQNVIVYADFHPLHYYTPTPTPQFICLLEGRTRKYYDIAPQVIHQACSAIQYVSTISYYFYFDIDTREEFIFRQLLHITVTIVGSSPIIRRSLK
jgi:hypothetical protein